MKIERLEPEMRPEGQVSRATGEGGDQGAGRKEVVECAAKQSMPLNKLHKENKGRGKKKTHTRASTTPQYVRCRSRERVIMT